MLPMPATTDWSMSSWPTATFREVSRSTMTSPAAARSSVDAGSGPSRSIAAAAPAGSSTSHADGPRRSATVSADASRTRT